MSAYDDDPGFLHGSVGPNPFTPKKSGHTMSAPSEAERLWREAKALNVNPNRDNQAAGHAAIDAAVRAAFEEGVERAIDEFKIRTGIHESGAVIHVHKGMVTSPPWLPAGAKEDKP